MNIVALSGRLGAEISEHITQSGKYVIHFPLAVRKSFKKDEREIIPSTISRSRYGERWQKPARSTYPRDSLSVYPVGWTQSLMTIKMDKRDTQRWLLQLQWTS